MQFKYSFTLAEKDRIPLIDVRIINKDNNIATNYRALLDSGAFASVFHTDIATVLGIDLEKISNKVLFGGVKDSKKQMLGKPYIVELMVINKGKSYKFESVVVFSDEVSNTGFGLLGRQGFFDQFKQVVFDYEKDNFSLLID